MIGDWLFRYRSWFPPLVLGVLGWAAGQRQTPNPGLDHQWLAAGSLVALVGLGVRAYVVGTAPRGTSGRNTLRHKASRLNTRGLYSVVRHPLYLGNALLWAGPALATGVWWTLPAVAIAFGLVYGPIIRVEERFLDEEFGEEFRSWARATPGLVPKLQGWKPPELRFSFKTVLRQEYYGFFTIVLMFVALDTIARSLALGVFSTNPLALVVLFVTTMASGVFRYLQRHSTLLDVPGR